MSNILAELVNIILEDGDIISSHLIVLIRGYNWYSCTPSIQSIFFVLLYPIVYIPVINFQIPENSSMW
jgi:hypothetical protein